MKSLSAWTAAASFLAASQVVGQQANSYVAYIASYQSLESARAGLDEVTSKAPQLFKDAKPHIHSVDLGAKGTWYRVQIGPPTSEAAMQHFCERLLKAGHNYCKVMTAFEVGQTTPGHSGELLLKPLGDGRNMQVAQQIEFVDSQGRRWTVPPGTKTDGASIPRSLWSIVGSPFTGTYLRAAVIHDHYTTTKYRGWMDTHDIFYDVMIADGTDRKQALLMWAAVYRFGPRWTKNESVCWGTCACSNIMLHNVQLVPNFHEGLLRKIEQQISEGRSVDIASMKDYIEENTYHAPEAGPYGTYGAKLLGVYSGGGCGSEETPDRSRIFRSESAPMNWSRYGKTNSTSVKFRVDKVAKHDTLNVRAGPGENHHVIGTLEHDAGNIEVENACTSAWCKVKRGSLEGWANTEFLTVDWSASRVQY